jgi:hypothetical protein
LCKLATEAGRSKRAEKVLRKSELRRGKEARQRLEKARDRQDAVTGGKRRAR